MCMHVRACGGACMHVCVSVLHHLLTCSSVRVKRALFKSSRSQGMCLLLLDCLWACAQPYLNPAAPADEHLDVEPLAAAGEACGKFPSMTLHKNNNKNCPKTGAHKFVWPHRPVEGPPLTIHSNRLYTIFLYTDVPQ